MANYVKRTRIRPDYASRSPAWPGRALLPGSIALKHCVSAVALALMLLPEFAVAAEQIANLSPVSSALSAPQMPAEPAVEARPAERHHRADFGRARASREAREIADWIVDSADNLGLPFVVVDKVDAAIFVFDAGGRIQGAAPALLGLARGDDTVPGIGDREFADMPPETRTTPAGRFVSSIGMDTRGEDVVWVDYEAAVSLHRVVTAKPAERRLQRLASATPLDNRISYGCINVPARFYENVVRPAFSGSDGIVYVLPETRPARVVFGSYDVDQRLARNYASRTGASK